MRLVPFVHEGAHPVLSFVLRRIGVSILILIAASFIMYTLVSLAKDPLTDLYASNSPNKDALIAQRIEWLNLDQPIPVRWLGWLGGRRPLRHPVRRAATSA